MKFKNILLETSKINDSEKIITKERLNSGNSNGLVRELINKAENDGSKNPYASALRAINDYVLRNKEKLSPEEMNVLIRARRSLRATIGNY